MCGTGCGCTCCGAAYKMCSQSAATDLATPIGRANARIVLLLEIQNIIIHQYPKPNNNLPASLLHPKLAACPRRHADDASLKSPSSKAASRGQATYCSAFLSCYRLLLSYYCYCYYRIIQVVIVIVSYIIITIRATVTSYCLQLCHQSASSESFVPLENGLICSELGVLTS